MSGAKRKSGVSIHFGPSGSTKGAASGFLGRSTSGWKKAATGKSAGGMIIDFRCIKHSPRVAIRKHKDTPEMYDFEKEQWQNAFEKMGKLQKLGLKPPAPFTILNEAPYHCPSLGRSFKVDYGPLSQVEGASVKGFVTKKKEIKQGMCQAISAGQLPTMTEVTNPDSVSTRLLTHTPRESFYYVPKSTVIVKWDPALHSNRQKICEWLLNTFGIFVFTITTDVNAQLVTFQSMAQAYEAVNFPLKKTARINISWYDPKFNNYANYMEAKDFNMSMDLVWKKMMKDARRRSRYSSRAVSNYSQN